MDRINNILYYIIVTAVILTGAYFFHSYLLALAGGAFVLVPPLSYGILRLGAGYVKINLDKNESRAKRGEELVFKAELVNRGFLPVISCRFKITFSNEYGEETRVGYVDSSVPAFGSRVISFNIKPVLCGRINVCAADMEIKDMLSFFRIQKECGEHFVIDIMPRRKKLETENTVSENAADNSDSMRKDTAGSDIIDVREYAPGDTLKSIHWKMSAKKDSLFVKERGEETRDNLVLLFELTKEDMNGIMDRVYSAARQFVLKGQSVKVCWAGSGSEQLESRIIEREKELYDLFSAVYSSMPSSEKNHGLTVARRQLSGGSIVYVEPNSEIRTVDL